MIIPGLGGIVQGIPGPSPAAGLAIVQSTGRASSMASATFVSALTPGNMLYAVSGGYTGNPGVNTGAGWTAIATHASTANVPSIAVAWRLVQAGDTTTQTPFTGSTTRQAIMMYELSGVDPTWTPSVELSTQAGGSYSGTTSHANDLLIAAGLAQKTSGDPGAGTVTGTGGTWTTDLAEHAASGIGAAAGSTVIGASGTPWTASVNLPNGLGTRGMMIVLHP